MSFRPLARFLEDSQFRDSRIRARDSQFQKICNFTRTISNFAKKIRNFGPEHSQFSPKDSQLRFSTSILNFDSPFRKEVSSASLPPPLTSIVEFKKFFLTSLHQSIERSEQRWKGINNSDEIALFCFWRPKMPSHRTGSARVRLLEVDFH